MDEWTIEDRGTIKNNQNDHHQVQCEQRITYNLEEGKDYKRRCAVFIYDRLLVLMILMVMMGINFVILFLLMSCVCIRIFVL